MSDDTFSKSAKFVETIKAIKEIADEAPEIKDAGRNLAVAAKTVTELVNNCLLPIAAVNFAFAKGREYFQGQFESDIEEVTSRILPENLVEPKPEIAAPVLMGLTFAHAEPDIKKLYLNLLGSAMNRETRPFVHPSFSEIIKQISVEEAPLLNLFLSGRASRAIVNLKAVEKLKGDHFVVKIRHLYNWIYSTTGEAAPMPDFPSIVDNWIRLGLAHVSYDQYSSIENAYDWVPTRPEYKEVSDSLEENEEIEVVKGTIGLSDFGVRFSRAVT